LQFEDGFHHRQLCARSVQPAEGRPVVDNHAYTEKLSDAVLCTVSRCTRTSANDFRASVDGTSLSIEGVRA
jgi:hypothetical protein